MISVIETITFPHKMDRTPQDNCILAVSSLVLGLRLRKNLKKKKKRSLGTRQWSGRRDNVSVKLLPQLRREDSYGFQNFL